MTLVAAPPTFSLGVLFAPNQTALYKNYELTSTTTTTTTTTTSLPPQQLTSTPPPNFHAPSTASRTSVASIAPSIVGMGVDLTVFGVDCKSRPIGGSGSSSSSSVGRSLSASSFADATAANAKRPSKTSSSSMDVDTEEMTAPLTPMQLAERSMQELQTFVEKLPNEIARLRASCIELDERQSLQLTKCTSRDQEQELIRRVAALKHYLCASLRMLQSRVDEKVLVERMRQMLDFFSRIPTAEKNNRSLLDAWNAMFDVNAVVSRTLAKDHCDTCKRPLLHNRKQSLLMCKFCAKVIEHWTPISQGNGWMKNSLASQPENKRIRSVIVKLNQFRVGTPPIPPEVIYGVRHWLKSRNHVSHDAIALPTPVTAALHALGYDRFVQYAAKIANLVNGFEVASITDEQINEIVARLRAIQLVFTFLQGRVERLAFHTNFFVASICKLRGWDQLAACFPPQRTRKILSDQLRLWRTLVFYLRQCDAAHAW
jgi:hypothetical protein